jgi:hypothetical protein
VILPELHFTIALFFFVINSSQSAPTEQVPKAHSYCYITCTSSADPIGEQASQRCACDYRRKLHFFSQLCHFTQLHRGDAVPIA